MRYRLTRAIVHAAFFVAVAAVSSALYAGDTATNEIVRKPLAISSGWELGQIVRGIDDNYNAKNTEGYFLNRLAVWITQETSVGQRLTFKMGVGGLFWYGFPAVPGSPVTLTTKFGPGISQATGIYKIGDLDAPLFELQFGYFPFKYNADAKDLGEYLLRSVPYPSLVRTGGWNIVNEALYRTLGFRVTNYLFDKALTQHLLATMERDLFPNHDISFSYIGDYNMKSIIDVGFGVTWHHAIAMNNDYTTPKTPDNRYAGDRVLSADDTVKTGFDYFTFKGIKLMAKASVNAQSIIKSDLLNKDDLKLYGELAVLGLKDYPVFYDDITKRIPIMIGLNLPTMKVLDMLSVELEWYGSSFPQSQYRAYENSVPQWRLSYPGIGDALPQDWDNPAAYTGPAPYTTYKELFESFYGKDNWKWSIYARKRFNKFFAVCLQMANDHMHPKYFDLRDTYTEVVQGNQNWYDLFKNDWYYVFRLDFGI